jgi:prophage regulatory protein
MPKRFIRLQEVRTRTGLARSTVYQKISCGEFPVQIAISARSVAWLESDVDSWIDDRISARGRDTQDHNASPKKPTERTSLR